MKREIKYFKYHKYFYDLGTDDDFLRIFKWLDN